jgi:hypothetical protein
MWTGRTELVESVRPRPVFYPMHDWEGSMLQAYRS